MSCSLANAAAVHAHVAHVVCAPARLFGSDEPHSIAARVFDADAIMFFVK